MKAQWIWLIATVSLLGTPAHADSPQKERSQPITLDVTEAYLEDVLKILSKQSGLNFVASEEAQSKKVTLYLESVPVITALEAILQANRLTMKPLEGSDLYVITETAVPKVATLTRIFQLRYARVVPTAGEILPTFGLSGSLITQTFSSTVGQTGGGVSGAGGGISGAGGGLAAGGEAQGGSAPTPSS
ncbi:MAG: hypothetical protein HYZ90_04245 [Candidatus Omnitrophica bacterium]|nr:hypothetical protein [Candidatus Omnitrophota bacterium]